MRNLILLFLVLSSPTYGQVDPYFSLKIGSNISYRNLSPINEMTEGWKIYFKNRRKVEKPAIRESFGLNLGLSLFGKLKIESGIFYNRLGDREKVEILTLQPEGFYDHETYRAKHSYLYLTVPIKFYFEIIRIQDVKVSTGLFGSYNRLLNYRTIEPRTRKETFGNPSTYSIFMTEINNSPLEAGVVLKAEKNIKENVNLDFEINIGSHIQPSLIRELVVEHTINRVSLRFGYTYFF